MTGNHLADQSDKATDNYDKCPSCGKHSLEIGTYCIAQDEIVDDCGVDGNNFCPIKKDDICEGSKQYRYCDCGYKDEI